MANNCYPTQRKVSTTLVDVAHTSFAELVPWMQAAWSLLRLHHVHYLHRTLLLAQTLAPTSDNAVPSLLHMLTFFQFIFQKPVSRLALGGPNATTYLSSTNNIFILQQNFPILSSITGAAGTLKFSPGHFNLPTPSHFRTIGSGRGYDPPNAHPFSNPTLTCKFYEILNCDSSPSTPPSPLHPRPPPLMLTAAQNLTTSNQITKTTEIIFFYLLINNKFRFFNLHGLSIYPLLVFSLLFLCV